MFNFTVRKTNKVQEKRSIQAMVSCPNITDYSDMGQLYIEQNNPRGIKDLRTKVNNIDL